MEVSTNATRAIVSQHESVSSQHTTHINLYNAKCQSTKSGDINEDNESWHVGIDVSSHYMHIYIHACVYWYIYIQKYTHTLK